jgi:hypothetical protein
MGVYVLERVGLLILVTGVSRPHPLAKRTNSLVTQLLCRILAVSFYKLLPHANLPTLLRAVLDS